MRDAVVIGGSGFIGSHLVKELTNEGRTVRVVSRGAAGRPAKEGLVEYQRGAVGSLADMLAAAEGAGCVYHLATGGGQSWADFERDFVGGARNVAEACRRQGVRRLVYASSTAALYLARDGVIDESTPADPKPVMRSYYARAKIEAENLLLDLHRREQLPLVIVRPAVVVGRGGVLSHSGVGLWCSDLHCMGWGSGRNPLPWVLVRDVARAMRAAGQAPGIEGRAFNLACAVEMSAREFVEELARRSRRRFRFHPRNLWIEQSIELCKWLLKVAARKAENPFPYYRDMVTRSFRTRLDCSAARDVLGWTPVDDREEFLREAIDSNLPLFAAGDLRLAEPDGVRHHA